MKIAVVCNTDFLAIPSIQFLKEKHFLAGIGIPERSKSMLRQSLQAAGIGSDAITVFSNGTWKEDMESWLQQLNPDAVFVIAFPWKIPASILSIPFMGFFNFHFGVLPKYKGADPIFWQIRNMESHGGLFIHKMNAEIDAGPVVWQKAMAIYPGENYDMHSIRIGYEAVEELKLVLDLMERDELKENIQPAHQGLYDQKPSVAQLTIDWEKQSAREIEYLVNACNQKYGGASTFLRNDEIRILEVSPVDMPPIPEQLPGTVVHADALYGLVIACKGQEFLKINVAHMREGYLSGAKLFSMGVAIGEQLI
ncbi:methionyl-tRNA formyltransferase [Pedobacter xixiisoli]|uniref:Methionyl-tRNA formyltransferase n=1 Tax=Pedobacter xixiisoli TaxID=1476464 RepID=A0A285ZUP9_9SPHI|nr:formyltransferase family protein [Pedobacter xixiisoli]SOD13374.1 methionyl-tRNA formyltransferase [Pedobacter xixiisoli]